MAEETLTWYYILLYFWCCGFGWFFIFWLRWSFNNYFWLTLAIRLRGHININILLLRIFWNWRSIFLVPWLRSQGIFSQIKHFNTNFIWDWWVIKRFFWNLQCVWDVSTCSIIVFFHIFLGNISNMLLFTIFFPNFDALV